MKMKLISLSALASCMMFASGDDDKRLNESATVLKEIQEAGDKAVPKSLFDKSVCAVIVPSLKKAGFIVGGKYGRGFASCRKHGGGWSAPSAVRIEGGSFGLQIGGSESDIILLMMNEKGMERLLANKFTIGGEASAAAGPVGRDASAMTDATMRAEMLSWSRSRGAFAGVSLDGATLRPDEDVNKSMYGAGADPKTILSGKTPATAASTELLALLTKFGGNVQKK
jgi:lipid-binding SYLF domain-containing protein